MEGIPGFVEGELETPDGPVWVEKTKIHEADGTALHSAVSAGCLKIVKILVEEGANLKAVDNDDQTPVTRAHKEGKEDIIAALTV